ncbi:MAG: oxygen-dependent coproporphyrinogen oxidase [Pelagibacteraceae bacterium]|jgi:coproporphyrinogen III oxidase|nr:oxygen-dependent coproporphyrinogen oxidase [Pelagibacteraceae bacterium]MDP6710211.1 oxygen-dependent coproporphyrinogen oxidase [Pelagibacteraceae bacterium]|tara:strand:- start:1589 stop:2398 length:810 start_codon:yes stop_codon:yes gene_type:complete
MKIEKKQKLTKEWFVELQNLICDSVEQLEKEYGSNIKFKKNKWKHGEYRTIKGKVIEKGGVAFSNVTGKFPKEFAKTIPGTKSSTNFWSSGVSVVFHPNNPKVPAMHFNTRFICTQKNWFGGGMDVTPCLTDNKEKKYFHSTIKKMCNLHNKKYYPKYKKWCDEYFYLPHRKEARGVGGIFFDYKMNNWKKDFAFIKDVGITFVYLVKKIMRKKMLLKWTQKEKKIQLLKRGRYVEFNLLYDRGTKFGLNSGGYPEAILMSMPPTAKWK